MIGNAIIADIFAGAGGASEGIKLATGVDPHIAANHDEVAVCFHRANHPGSHHFLSDIREVDPYEAVAGRDVAALWASWDCRHFSRAKGGKPVSESVRALPWVVPRWLAATKARCFFGENVPEFKGWCPLVDGRPDPKRKGETFKRWLHRLEKLGYEVEHQELSADNYGAPTKRKRLFIIARNDGERIVWPKHTHGPGLAKPESAASCIDWNIPCPSIFERKIPLEEATLRRIARGIQKFVIDSTQPFFVPVTHGSDNFRGFGADEQFPTITGANRGELAMIAPTLVAVSWGEREGQAPRCMDPQKPFGAVVAGGIKHAVAVAHLMQAYGGNYHGAGSSLQLSLPTITARDHNWLVTSNLVVLRNHCDGVDVRSPAPTECASGLHIAETRAFLSRYNGTSTGQQPQFPFSTLDTRDRFAVVTINSVDYIIVDIGFRMLTPRELFNAQGFRRDYIIDPFIPSKGRTATKTEQVRAAGNSVCPAVAKAIVGVNVDPSWIRRAA